MVRDVKSPAGGRGVKEVRETDTKGLAERIREAIRRSGLKQWVVAERCGFSGQMLTDMLCGRKVIKAEFIPKLCTVLGVTPNQVFGWEEFPAGM